MLWPFRFGVWGLRFGAWGLGLGAWGLGFQRRAKTFGRAAAPSFAAPCKGGGLFVGVWGFRVLGF